MQPREARQHYRGGQKTAVETPSCSECSKLAVLPVEEIKGSQHSY